ncbi:hypothetical protein BDV33DRAFT_177560 [Aspergillus novoparasiticus]|uniref:Uncharacterized protein n=1 Tax=Aspergillus novoparasiticus TaxID=986946 RepID=A0A5N6ELG8_9EURO|nr:hypothetical protein BDV33DRAFT_177560 [Aspergillus novoparasiticus]
MLITYGDHHKRKRGKNEVSMSPLLYQIVTRGKKEKKKKGKKINRSPIFILINFNFSGGQIMINY